MAQMLTISADTENYGTQDDNVLFKPRNKDEVLAALHREMRTEHLSEKTEESYRHYIVEFIDFKLARHSMHTDEDAIREFLAYAALDKYVAKTRFMNVVSPSDLLYEDGTHICPHCGGALS